MNITDIVLETRALCDADSTSYPDSVLLRRINSIYERIIGKLISIGNRDCDFDDSNYSTFPIGVYTMVEGQEDYSIDTTHLIVLKLEVQGSDGIWHELERRNLDNIGMPLEEFEKTKGFPNSYLRSGSSYILKPAPSASYVTLTAGLRVYFQRSASVFADLTTTKSPGFASPYHMILCYEAAIPYCMSYKKDRVALYEKKSMDLQKELFTFDANKDKDVSKRLTMGGISFQ